MSLLGVLQQDSDNFVLFTSFKKQGGLHSSPFIQHTFYQRFSTLPLVGTASNFTRTPNKESSYSLRGQFPLKHLLNGCTTCFVGLSESCPPCWMCHIWDKQLQQPANQHPALIQLQQHPTCDLQQPIRIEDGLLGSSSVSLQNL